MDPMDQFQQLANVIRQIAPIQQQQQNSAAVLPDFEQFSPSDTESGKFSRWFSRFQHFLALHCADWEESRKISLLMTKLDGKAYEQFESSLLPGRMADITRLDECVEKLRCLFDAKRTLFMDRCQTLQVQIQEGEDIRALGNRVNRLVAEFDLANFTEDHLKSILFLQALKPKKYAKVRMRLLQTLQSDPKRKLEDLMGDCNLYLAAVNLMAEEKSPKVGGKKGEQQQQQQQMPAKKSSQPALAAPSAPSAPVPVTIVVNQQQQQQQRHHHQNQPYQNQPVGPVPANYICHICKAKADHWIWQCPKKVPGFSKPGAQCQQQVNLATASKKANKVVNKKN